MESSFSEMRCKQVINVADGSLLGHICDMVFDIRSSRILGFVVPGCKQGFSFFRPTPEIFIPYCNICKIGEDVILVEVCNLPTKTKRIKILNDAKTLSSPYQNPQDYESVTASKNTQAMPQNQQNNIQNKNLDVSNSSYSIGNYKGHRDDDFLNK